MRKRRFLKGIASPQAICDRSGKKYPYGEMVLEPSTGWFVHRSESDGNFNLIDHPQANIKLPGRREMIPLKNARPDTSLDEVNFIGTDGPDGIIVDEQGLPLTFFN